MRVSHVCIYVMYILDPERRTSPAYYCAGLDWRVRNGLVALLSKLKHTCSILVISHDLRELAPITDSVWHMKLGGHLEYAGTVAPVRSMRSRNIDVL
jgi:energy-coupling factor transporter ATP-binding protein EcfA2